MNGDARAQPPTLSILLLCWNHARYLEQCIASIARQGPQEFEIVFLDNVSSDGSFELARTLFDRFGLTATMIRNDRPRSIAANFNRLLEASHGAVVAPLSTDDWYDDDYVATLTKAAGDDPEAGWFSCSGWTYIDDEQRDVPIDDSIYPRSRWLLDTILDGGDPHFFVGCAYRRSALEAVGGWDEEQLIEDRDLFLRLSKHFPHRRIAQRLVHYRRTTGSISNNAEFMRKGWDLLLDKHAAAFGKRLPALRAASLRANAALLIDQGDRSQAFALLWRSLRLAPVSVTTYRTMLYLLKSVLRAPRRSR